MKVKLISYSQSSDEFWRESGGMTSLEDLIAYAARVSNPTNQHNKETAPKLIKYLVSNKHWSPLEMVSATLEIETTRDIARQILRHRSFSFQEFSQRYADPTQMEGELREARLQDKKNRQNSISISTFDAANVLLKEEWERRQSAILSQVFNTYKWALDNGVAKEQARCVLPEGMTQSRMYMAGTLRSWVHYIQLRTSSGTQKEHRDVANACAEALKTVFPMVDDLLLDV